jgi:hypothetical protein
MFAGAGGIGLWRSKTWRWLAQMENAPRNAKDRFPGRCGSRGGAVSSVELHPQWVAWRTRLVRAAIEKNHADAPRRDEGLRFAEAWAGMNRQWGYTWQPLALAEQGKQLLDKG